MGRTRKRQSKRANENAALPSDAVQFPLIALAVITAIGTLLRLEYLRQPIRYDEAVTYLIFARLPWLSAIADYRYPNNHVLHTVLVKIAVAMFGNEPWAIRLPAFAAGILSIPAAYAAARALYGQRVALVTAALVAGCGALTLYATNARGYTMVVLATLVLIILSARAQRTTAVWPWVAFAVVGAAGLWTVPVMLYPLGGVTLWSLFAVRAARGTDSPVTRRWRAARALLAFAGACVLGATLYLPVILRSGIGALAGNNFVTPSTFDTFLAEVPTGFGDAARLMLTGIGWPFAMGLIACAIAGIVYHRRWSNVSTSLFTGMAVWCTVLLLVMHRVPFARVWLFLFPMVAMVTAIGLIALVTPRLGRAAGAPLAVSVCAVLLSVALAAADIVTDGVRTADEWETFPDAEAVARTLAPELRAGDRIVSTMPKAVADECKDCGYSAMQLTYWFDKLGVDTTAMQLPAAQTRRFLFVVNLGEEGGRQAEDSIMRKFAAIPTAAAPAIVAEFPHAMVFSVSP